jgi:predicted O-methyltransferase YrrM
MTNQAETFSDILRLAWRGVKKAFRPAKKILVREVERSSTPYATHIPVLIGLAQLLTFRRVAEFGCGQYSTLTFLDRQIFPHLERLDSFETDPEWLTKIEEQSGGDSRLTLRNVIGEMSAFAESIKLDQYDLIFIDDSTRAEDRAETIQVIANKRERLTVVVVHDYEIKLYQQAASLFLNRFRCNALNPNTGILWNDAHIGLKKLRAVNNVIRQHRNVLEPDELRKWGRAFRES